MSTAGPAPSGQRGVALLMLLVAILMAGSYLIYRHSNRGASPYQHSSELASTLARAKEALIARAVTDANRPGSLPCPDLVTDNAGLGNYPGDGKSDMFTLTQCPSYVGWLPWVTLDLPELTDDSGTRLWYVLAPPLRDDDSAQPINSDTTTAFCPPEYMGVKPAKAIRIDQTEITNPPICPSIPESSTRNDIAALVIATRGTLDPRNSDDDGYFYNANYDHSVGPIADNNDVVASITRQELMAAVEKRVANEVKSCLEQHAAAAANTAHTYPWPAPFAASNWQGRAGSYFGQLPTTQPGNGPAPMLQQSIAELASTRSSLSSASDAAQQLSLMVTLSASLSYARNLFDALYIASNRLWQASQSNTANLTALNTELSNDLRANRQGNVSIINSERDRIRTKATTVYDQIEQLPAALAESGIDAFPQALKARTDSFANLPTAANTAALVTLLSRSTTQHVDIAPKLSAALAAALGADGSTRAAAANPGDSVLAATATQAADTLLTALASLQNTIRNSRINTHHSEISPYAGQLGNLNAKLGAAPNASNAAALASKLGEAKAAVDRIATGTSSIVATRAASVQALNDALLAAQAAVDFPLIASSTNNAIGTIDALSSTMRDNDDNLTRSSLAAASADFVAARSAFANLTTSNTRSRVPYAQALQSATVDVDFWAKIIADKAYALAAQAKAIPVVAGSDITAVVPLAGSAYQAASTALTGSQTATSALQAYLDTPTQNKQTAAATALNNATTQLDSLLSQASTVEANLSSSSASAFPIVWQSSRCDFLQPSLASWWKDNQWATTLFYQIGNRSQTAPGTLKVNGAGGYRLVAIAASRALAGQSRATRSSANYFEGLNADSSRDSNAETPSLEFESKAPVSTFNDRLAY